MDEIYNDLLEDSNIILPVETESSKHVYHLYVVRTENRDHMQQYLQKNNIQTLIHYPIPVHMQKAYSKYRSQFILPNTERICKEILSLPRLYNEEVYLISNVIKNEYQYLYL